MRETCVLKLNPEDPDNAILSYGAKIIRAGGIVAFPTETVYGLAVNLLDKDAVKKLYKIKKRSHTKPFTVHIKDQKMIGKMGCKITEEAKALIDKFWPGPLTIILKSKDAKKIGFRMPANKIALGLIKASRVPVVAPSANISGERSPRSAKEVLKYFSGKIDMLIDGGPTDIGVESTVVDLTFSPPKVLREGAIKKNDILEALKLRITPRLRSGQMDC